MFAFTAVNWGATARTVVGVLSEPGKYIEMICVNVEMSTIQLDESMSKTQFFIGWFGPSCDKWVIGCARVSTLVLLTHLLTTYYS